MATIAVEAAPEGKKRVRAAAWEDARVILKDQVLELRNTDRRIRVARKDREHDDHDVPVPVYDPPMGPAKTSTSSPQRVTCQVKRVSSTPRHPRPLGGNAFHSTAPAGAAMCTACASSSPLKRLVTQGLPKPSAGDGFHIEKGPDAWPRSVAKYSAPVFLPHFVGDAGLR